MKERDDRLVLDAAALAGEILLESGAEIFRVEDTIYRIAAAYGVEEAEAFVPPEWFTEDVTMSGEYQNSRLSSGKVDFC